MIEIILHLGGSLQRLTKTIQLAKEKPTSLIIVSSEGDPREVMRTLLGAGIERYRIVLDYQAWDTVTNFTKTKPLIKKTGTTKLYVVTDGFHMTRSMGIGHIVYFGSDMSLVACPSSDGGSEPWDLLIGDWIRALVWRLTGYQHKWNSVYESRLPQLKIDAAIAKTL
jgi:uncharacterized SAM-binding protein YcdF (DUF218 family)